MQKQAGNGRYITHAFSQTQGCFDALMRMLTVSTFCFPSALCLGHDTDIYFLPVGFRSKLAKDGPAFFRNTVTMTLHKAKQVCACMYVRVLRPE
jgi:hypothetical protein